MVDQTYVSDSRALCIVEKRDQVVSRMRYHGTEYPSYIATSKAHCKLQRFATLLLWLGNDMLVYHLNNCLKRSKFHHCICMMKKMLSAPHHFYHDRCKAQNSHQV